jgi:molybdopterin-guanine dinucleotide biosynthesis protein A
MPVAGFVLVGGRSERMGRDKARLPVNIESLSRETQLLVQEIAGNVKCAAGNVTLVGAAARYCDLPFECLEDLRPSLGPLAGIETALATMRSEQALIVACDMPGLDVSWLRQLIDEAVRRRVACLISKDSDGSLHPLCGIWSSRCLPSVRQALDEGCRRVLAVTRQLDAEFLESHCPIHNLNTPGDWAAWQTRLQS